MKRCATFFVVVALACGVSAISACPERKETIEKVGGAPKTEIDTAKARLHADEQKIQKNTNEAADVKE